MSSYKFKSGDRVKVVNLRQGTNDNDKYIEVGMTGTVIEDRSDRPWVEFDVDICSGPHFNSYRNSNKRRTMCMWEDEIDFILPIMKKSDLQNGDIVTYRNEEKRMVDKNREALVLITNFNQQVMCLSNFDEDLFDAGDVNCFDIVKVYRPLTEETFRTEKAKPVKEMTLKEVCKELGYEVKIVKEEN